MGLANHQYPTSISTTRSKYYYYDDADARQPVCHVATILLPSTTCTLTYINRIGSITGAAGAGFRLSLVLNAVKMKMGSADTEIIKISKSISDFSLMLKQVGKAMEEGEVIASPLAIDTVFDIQEHSERVFDEIKSMTELAQVRDKDGHLTEIGIGQKVTWCFKKQKVPYLLGQLDYLKLNLAIMLQILQLGKTLGSTRYAAFFYGHCPHILC